MNVDCEKINEIWVSGTYSTVFFSQKEVSNFLDSLLNEDRSPPKGLNVAFIPRKLTKPYTKKEILNAGSDELKIMLGIEE